VICGHLPPPPWSESGTGDRRVIARRRESFWIPCKDITRHWYNTIASARKGRGKPAEPAEGLQLRLLQHRAVDVND